MQPNTPHFVVMPQSAICHGGHFYAMSMIWDTIFGIHHMFVASRNITNTEHTQDAHLLLWRLVVYTHYIHVKRGSKHNLLMVPPTPHIPDISTFEGMIDLFMLCIIMELSNLINPLAYKKKYQCDHDRDYDQLCTIRAHGLSRDLRNWWCARYMFMTERQTAVWMAKLYSKTCSSSRLTHWFPTKGWQRRRTFMVMSWSAQWKFWKV